MPMFAINSEAEFQKSVLENKDIVMCGFTADWCPHCKALAPKFKELAEKMPNLNIYRVDVDKAEAVADKYQIMTIPTIAFFKNGQMQSSMMVAGKDFSEIMQFIQNNLQ